jgi:hypothetical protein
MKKLLLLLFPFLLSCEGELSYIGQEIVDGKISAINKGHHGRYSTLPEIYVQSPTATKKVRVPFVYEDRWKV